MFFVGSKFSCITKIYNQLRRPNQSITFTELFFWVRKSFLEYCEKLRSLSRVQDASQVQVWGNYLNSRSLHKTMKLQPSTRRALHMCRRRSGSWVNITPIRNLVTRRFVYVTWKPGWKLSQNFEVQTIISGVRTEFCTRENVPMIEQHRTRSKQ